MSDKFEIGDEVGYKFNATAPNGIVIDIAPGINKICIFIDNKRSKMWVDAALYYKTERHFYFAEYLKDMVSKEEYQELKKYATELEERYARDIIDFGEAVKFKCGGEKVGIVIQSNTNYKVMDSTGHTYVIDKDEIIERTGRRFEYSSDLLEFLKEVENHE